LDSVLLDSLFFRLGLVQYLVYILFYQHFVEDKILNFIDLCSVSNISMFILSNNQYGYYIHGRSPQGTADINMKEMLDYFTREENKTIGSRGLEVNTTDQTFIVHVNQEFRKQYGILLSSYQVKSQIKKSSPLFNFLSSFENQIRSHKTRKDEERESEILLVSYRNLNEFLMQFIEHSIPIYDYSIRRRVLVEQIFNWDFRTKSTENVFLIGKNKIILNLSICIFFFIS